MANKPYYGLPDTGLRDWGQNASTQLTATPADFHISLQQAADFATLVDDFNTALTLWQTPATHTPVNFEAKQAARAALIAGAKYIVNTINSNPLTTDAQRRALNFPIRKTPTPTPVPSVQPNLDNVSMNGHTFSATVHGGDSARNKKPAGVQGISIFTQVGDQPDFDWTKWTFISSQTKLDFSVDFDPSLAPGTKVWVTVFFWNGKAESGPAATPVYAYIQYGGMAMAA